jgi:hypothetical protein
VVASPTADAVAADRAPSNDRTNIILLCVSRLAAVLASVRTVMRAVWFI